LQVAPSELKGPGSLTGGWPKHRRADVGNDGLGKARVECQPYPDRVSSGGEEDLIADVVHLDRVYVPVTLPGPEWRHRQQDFIEEQEAERVDGEDRRGSPYGSAAEKQVPGPEHGQAECQGKR
jgi:hypothetical protein